MDEPIAYELLLWLIRTGASGSVASEPAADLSLSAGWTAAAFVQQQRTARLSGRADGWTGIPYDDDVSAFAAEPEIAAGRRIALQLTQAVRARGLLFDAPEESDIEVPYIDLGTAVKQRG